jgi:hypothetical protein
MHPQDAVIQEYAIAVKFHEVHPRGRENHVAKSQTHRYNLVAGREANRERSSPAYEILRGRFNDLNVDRHRARSTDELRRHAHSTEREWVTWGGRHHHVVEYSQEADLALADRGRHPGFSRHHIPCS